MSASLVYEPVRPPKPKYLSYELKVILNEKYDLGNGGQTLDATNISYLEGLKDAGHKELGGLIDAINKHDQVKIWLHY